MTFHRFVTIMRQILIIGEGYFSGHFSNIILFYINLCLWTYLGMLTFKCVKNVKLPLVSFMQLYKCIYREPTAVVWTFFLISVDIFADSLFFYRKCIVWQFMCKIVQIITLPYSHKFTIPFRFFGENATLPWNSPSLITVCLFQIVGRNLSYPDDFWPRIHWGSWDAT